MDSLEPVESVDLWDRPVMLVVAALRENVDPLVNAEQPVNQDPLVPQVYFYPRYCLATIWYIRTIKPDLITVCLIS